MECNTKLSTVTITDSYVYQKNKVALARQNNIEDTVWLCHFKSSGAVYED